MLLFYSNKNTIGSYQFSHCILLYFFFYCTIEKNFFAESSGEIVMSKQHRTSNYCYLIVKSQR